MMNRADDQIPPAAPVTPPQSPAASSSPAPIPRPIVKKMRWPFPIIWLVPIAALIVTCVYLYLHHREYGPLIAVRFTEAQGVQVDETTVQFRGVEIGKVAGIDISPDQQKAILYLRLKRSADAFARNGAMFWIVRPQITTDSISGLGTLVSGPYIQAMPGTGDIVKDFTALDQPLPEPNVGLHITLMADQAEKLQRDSFVYYRGLQVGVVEDVQLASDATHVNVYAVVWRRYANLVHSNSRFWKVTGAEIKGGVLTGLDVKLGSIRSMMVGGVTFATPDKDMGVSAREGDQFILHDTAKSDWLNWAPKMRLEAKD